MSWIDANEQVPDLFKFTGQSLPVLVIAETGDAAFEKTMAVYHRNTAKYGPAWRLKRFDDRSEGRVINVRCWQDIESPKEIPGKWFQKAIASSN